MNTGAAVAGETFTVNSPVTASGEVLLLAVTEYEKPVVPVGGVPETSPVVELMVSHVGAAVLRAYVGRGVPVAMNV